MVSPYGNWMDYIYVFSIGEILRSGVEPNVKPTIWMAFGYTILAFAEFPPLAPFYLYRVFKNMRHTIRSNHGETVESSL